MLQSFVTSNTFRELIVSSGYPSSRSDNGLVALVYLYVLANDDADSSSPSSALVRVTSEIPLGAGLGSSAAYAVSLAAALWRAFGGGGGGGGGSPPPPPPGAKRRKVVHKVGDVATVD